MRHGQFRRQIRTQSNAVIFSSGCFIQWTKRKDKNVCWPKSFGCIRYIRKGPFLSYPYSRSLHAGSLNAQTLADSVTTHTRLGRGGTSNQRYGSNKIMTYVKLIQYNGKNEKKTVVNWNLRAEKRLFQSSQKICDDVTSITLDFKIIGIW